MSAESIPDDPYELLGVARGATREQIKAGRLKEVMKWHPDHNKGDDRRFRAIEEAYEMLLDASDPYLTPNKITWVAQDDDQPSPTIVRLSNRGGAVKLVEPEPVSGIFWTIEAPTAVMTGEALFDFTIAPLALDAMEVGSHHDEIRFIVDSHIVTLTISLSVRAKKVPPPPRPTPPPPDHRPVSPTTPPVRSSSPSDKTTDWEEVWTSGCFVALWYFFFAEGWAGFRVWWNPAALIPVVIWLIYAILTGLGRR